MAQEVNTGDMIVVRATEAKDTSQTPGMVRKAGVADDTVGSQALWLGRATMRPKSHSGAHHHGDSESAIYVLSGRARFRFGPNLEKSVEVEAGDFIYVPPFTLHQEVNPSDSEPAEMVVARADNNNVVVNVDVPEEVLRPM